MHRTVVVLGVAVGSVVAAPARADDRATCAAVLDSLRAELRDRAADPLPLTDPPTERAEDGDTTVDACEGFDQVDGSERGRLGGRRATARSDGPHGSGRFWTVTVAVRDHGTVRGACFTTTTRWWRNLPDAGRARFGAWRLFHGDALHVWSTLAVGDDEWSVVMLPLVLRGSNDQLALDLAATAAELRRAGRIYAQVARMRGDPAPALHRAAAAAFTAFADGTGCAP